MLLLFDDLLENFEYDSDSNKDDDHEDLNVGWHWQLW